MGQRYGKNVDLDGVRPRVEGRLAAARPASGAAEAAHDAGQCFIDPPTCMRVTYGIRWGNGRG